MEKIAIKPDFIIREVAGDKVLLPVGRDAVNFSKMVVLNDTAACVVETLLKEGPQSLDELTALLLEQYEVDEATARKDLEELVERLKKEQMLVE